MIDSPSSGERKGKSLNACVCKRCSVAICGLMGFLVILCSQYGSRGKENGTELESQAGAGKSPVRETFLTEQRNTRVQRDTWNPVGISEDHLARLNTTQRPIVNKYREGKVKSTPARGVKENLKPCACKPLEPVGRKSGVTEYLLHNESASYVLSQG